MKITLVYDGVEVKDNIHFLLRGDACSNKYYFSMEAVVSLLLSLYRRGLRWRSKKIDWFKNNDSVFFLSYFIHLDPRLLKMGKFFSRQWGKLPELFLDSNIGANWIHHFVSNKEVPDRNTGDKYHEVFNNDSSRQDHHEYLDAYCTVTLLGRVLVQYFKLLYNLPKYSSISNLFVCSNSNVWFWPYLKQDWYDSTIGKTAIQNLLWGELFNASMSDIPQQKLGFYLMENQGWERAFINSWKCHGHGKLVGVAHSTVRFWDLRYFDDPNTFLSKTKYSQPIPDLIALTGPDMVKKYREAKYPVDHLVEVEALRYIKNSSTNEIINKIIDPDNNTDLILPHKRVLILGSGDDTFTSSLLQVMDNLASKLKCYKFSFKAHPAAPVDVEVFKQLHLSEITDNLSDITSLFDIALIVGETGAALDVYIDGLGVIVYDINQGVNLSPLRGVDDVIFCRTSDDLYLALESFGSLKSNQENEAYFWRDAELPRWRTLLSKLGCNQLNNDKPLT